jgi:hypothetical protein
LVFVTDGMLERNAAQLDVATTWVPQLCPVKVPGLGV